MALEMINPSAIDNKVDSDHEKADGYLNGASKAAGINEGNEILLNEATAIS